MNKHEFLKKVSEMIDERPEDELKMLLSDLEFGVEKLDYHKTEKPYCEVWGSRFNYSLQMKAEIPKKGEKPFSTKVRFFLQSSGGEKGFTTIGPNMITINETREKINSLRKELDQIEENCKEVFQVWGLGSKNTYYQDATKKELGVLREEGIQLDGEEPVEDNIIF